MIDTRSARTIQNALKDEGVSLEAVFRMQMIAQDVRSGGYTILALQRDDITFLVWVTFDESGTLVVKKVKKQAW